MPSSDNIGLSVAEYVALQNRYANKRNIKGYYPVKSAKKRVPRNSRMMTFEATEYYNALLADEEPVVDRNSERAVPEWRDSQFIQAVSYPDDEVTTESLSPEELINRLAASRPYVPVPLICEIELTRFNVEERQRLLPLLWQYILQHRDDNNLDTITAVGAAIRKYIALMPMEEMGQLAVLLESGHKSAMPIELEIEVAKMIYRNFEVHPPRKPNPHPELANSLWEMVQAYANPRLLPHGKYSAVASMAIQALVVMRSEFAAEAVRAAFSSPYRWFSEVVADSLDRLYRRWKETRPDAAVWLASLQKEVQVTA